MHDENKVTFAFSFVLNDLELAGLIGAEGVRFCFFRDVRVIFSWKVEGLAERAEGLDTV